MRKLIQMLVIACMVVLGTQVAFANYDEGKIMEGADLLSIQRIAIGAPLYPIVNEDAPNKETLTQILSDASRVAHGYEVLSYDTVAENISKANGVNIKVLNKRQSTKLFKDNVAKYADAYVILTVANNSRTTFFFDVFKAGTNELLYTYEIRANRSEGDSAGAYKNYCEQFFKHLDRAADSQIKKKFSKKE